MPAPGVRPERRVRLSVSRTGLVPELGIALGTIAITTAVHWLFLIRFEQGPPLVLFAATAAALTFWRGLGPGMLASSIGTAVGSALVLVTPGQIAPFRESLGVQTLLWFGGSMFTCWLIYRLKADQEDQQAIQGRKNDALAFVSHELRQPLATIHLAATLLERDPSEDTRSRATALIRRSATRLGRVVDDLADVTLFQAGAIKVEASVIRLQEPVLAAVDATRPAIEQRLQSLETDVAPEPPLWVSGDSLRLQQVFANVLSNACKYSPEGSELSISCRAQDGRAVVVVRDSGVGISPHLIEAIFDPFVRESGPVADGLGIGLTLARNLVTQHGGRISAHSDGPGRGSTFVIELPLLPADHALSA